MTGAVPVQAGREGSAGLAQHAHPKSAVAQPPRASSALTARADGTASFDTAVSSVEGRVILYLGGIRQPAQCVEQYLRDRARKQCNFRGALLVTCGATGFGNATLGGPGALHAAISLLGRHSESVGIAEVKEHARAWYCPCGHPTLCKGPYSCHGCGGARPSSLQAALEQAVRRHQLSALPPPLSLDSGVRGPRNAPAMNDSLTLHRWAFTPPPPQASSSVSAAAARRNANATNATAAAISKRSDSAAESIATGVSENRAPEALAAESGGELLGTSPPRKAARRDACDAASLSVSRAARLIPPVATAPRSPARAECGEGACSGTNGAAGAAGSAGSAGGACVRQRVPLWTSTWSEGACFGFRKLAAAEALAAQNGRSWRVWAEDVAAAHGAPKRYFTSKVEAIHRLICAKSPGHRHFYEVIDQGLPCWSYFDLEFDRSATSGLNSQSGEAPRRERWTLSGVSSAPSALSPRILPSSTASGAVIWSQVDGNELTGRIIDAASDVLRESIEAGFSGGGRGREICDAPQLRIEALVLDSHRADKFSRHLLLKTHTSQAAPLSGSDHAGRLARAVSLRLGDALAVDKPTKDDAPQQQANFIDLSVYTRSRCFRLMGCSKGGCRKPGSGASPCLTPNWALTSSSLAPLLRSAGKQALLASLVVPLTHGAAASSSPRTIDISAVRTVETLPPVVCDPAPQPCAQQRTDAKAGERGARGGEALCGASARTEESTASSADGRTHLLDGEAAVGAARRVTTAEEPAGIAPAAADARAPLPEEMWAARVRLLSSSPLLDLVQSVSHPFICAKTHGDGMPPLPFSPLAEWAVEQIRAFGGGFPNATICGWRYCRSAHPTEALLHLMPKGTRYCYHIGREHRSQNTMLTISLIEERAWQRCWDADCVVPSRVPAIDLKAKHACSSPSPTLFPSLMNLINFERSRGLLNDSC